MESGDCKLQALKWCPVKDPVPLTLISYLECPLVISVSVIPQAPEEKCLAGVGGGVGALSSLGQRFESGVMPKLQLTSSQNQAGGIKSTQYTPQISFHLTWAVCPLRVCHLQVTWL